MKLYANTYLAVRGLHGLVGKVLDCQLLAPHSCGFEPSGFRLFFKSAGRGT